MRSPRTRTLQLTLIGVAALLFAALILVIAGVDSFDFRSARPLEYSSAPSGGSDSEEATGWRAVAILMRVLVTIAVVVVIFQILFHKGFRLFYLVLIFIFVGILLLAEFGGCNRSQPAGTDEPETGEMLEPPERLDWAEPLPDAPRSTNLHYILAALAVSGVVVAIAGFALIRWLRAHPREEETAVTEILETLSTAARRIRAGEDPYTVVLYCYQEMLRILSVAGRIDATYLTPREFQLRLQQAGLSGEDVAQLTEMFEVVRYAGRVDASFAERALACLDAIQEAHVTDE